MAKLGIFLVLTLVILLNLLLTLQYAETIRLGLPKDPQILLKRYTSVDSEKFKPLDTRFRTQAQFQNEFVSKKGNDFVISDEVLAVYFVCEATYPITWTFPFPKQIHEVPQYDFSSKEYRYSELNPYHQEPTNQKFISEIYIAVGYIKFLSVNLTCSSVENKPELDSSIYIFLNHNQPIEHEEKTLQIFAEPSTDYYAHFVPTPLILPCRPASPDMKVSLEKQTVTTTHYIDGNITRSVSWMTMDSLFSQHGTFDPKVGYSMRRDVMGNWIFGLYRCSVLNNDESDSITVQETTGPFVYFNVTRADNATMNLNAQNQAFQSKSVIRGQASVHLNLAGANEMPFTCCTGPGNKPPIVYVGYCQNALTCQILESFIAQGIITEKIMKENQESYKDQINPSTVCGTSHVFSESAVVMCKGQDVDFMERYVSCFHRLAGGAVANRSAAILHDKITGDHVKDDNQFVSLATYESAALLQSNGNVAQKMIILVGRKILRMKSKTSTNRNYHPFMIYANNLEDYIYAEDFDYDDYDDIERIDSRFPYDRFVEYNRDVYYEGESLTFMCFGLKMEYAIGARLALVFDNGTKTSVEPKSTAGGRMKRTYLMNVVYLSGGVNGRLPDVFSIFGKNTTATQGMNSVDCWMPKRSSSKWDKISKQLKILPSFAPKFVERAEETLYFYLGDTGKVVTCTASEGAPLPRVKVLRNGQRLKISLIEYANATQFPKIGTNQTAIIDKNKNVVAVRILFAAVGHDHQAEFQCLAGNVNSTITRVVRIFVLEKSGKALPIFLSFFAILVFVLTGLGIKHWYHKRHVNNLASESR